MVRKLIVRENKRNGRWCVLLTPIDGGRPIELGIATEIRETLKINRISRKNYQTVAGGELDAQEEIVSCQATATITGVSPKVDINALTAAGKDYRIEYQGLSEVDSGLPVLVRYHRVQLGQAYGLVRRDGDYFAELMLTMTILADTSRTGRGESQYMEIMMV